jgi:signal peptidase II
MKTRIKIILFLAMSVAFISCDQVTKDLARKHLQYEQPKSYFHDTFRFIYVENTGAALSLGDTLPQPYAFWLLSILPAMFLVGLSVYVLSKIRRLTPANILFMAMVIAGGIGNIIDRIFNDRHVTDFMNVGISGLRTGIFNVADMCITAGVIGLFFTYKSMQQPPAEVTEVN